MAISIAALKRFADRRERFLEHLDLAALDVSTCRALGLADDRLFERLMLGNTAAAWPHLWQYLMHDVPARLNPLWTPVSFSKAMSAVLKDACDDKGAIWLANHKIVPRGLFKTPFGPLLLGSPWRCANLPFGLWCSAHSLQKDMLPELRDYYEMRSGLEAYVDHDTDGDYPKEGKSWTP